MTTTKNYQNLTRCYRESFSRMPVKKIKKHDEKKEFL